MTNENNDEVHVKLIKSEVTLSLRLYLISKSMSPWANAESKLKDSGYLIKDAWSLKQSFQGLTGTFYIKKNISKVCVSYKQNCLQPDTNREHQIVNKQTIER